MTVQALEDLRANSDGPPYIRVGPEIRYIPAAINPSLTEPEGSPASEWTGEPGWEPVIAPFVVSDWLNVAPELLVELLEVPRLLPFTRIPRKVRYFPKDVRALLSVALTSSSWTVPSWPVK